MEPAWLAPYNAGIFKKKSSVTSNSISALSLSALEHEAIVLLETHIDHLSGEDLGHAIQVLSEQSLDVLWLPGIMKKGRPAGLLRVLSSVEQVDAVETAIYRHTHTLGIRKQMVERSLLPRKYNEVSTDYGNVANKEYTIDGQEFSRLEYEALRILAEKTGKSLPELRQILVNDFQ